MSQFDFANLALQCVVSEADVHSTSESSKQIAVLLSTRVPSEEERPWKVEVPCFDRIGACEIGPCQLSSEQIRIAS